MKTLYWLRNDLRLHDNLALLKACQGSQTLNLIYTMDKSLARAGVHRKQYALKTLKSFDESLRPLGQHLTVTKRTLVEVLNASCPFDRVVATKSYNSRDQLTESQVQDSCGKLGIPLDLIDQQPLILKAQLPLSLEKLKSFTPFRQAIEKSVSPNPPLPAPRHLPEPLSLPWPDSGEWLGSHDSNQPLLVSGSAFYAGEPAGLRRLEHYLWSSRKALTYKETRNGMIALDDSTKLSPYLALGSLSPRRIFAELKAFENEVEANESTYWIFFELLWRDFFKFYSLKQGARLFHLGGPKALALEWTKAPERNRHWHRWTEGVTGQDFVDANMRELKSTGWMSNRGRQNVASYWSKHLTCDWRLGARWLEKQLIDFDVESNWGNWAYNSGVGPDPRDRKFDLERQAQMYDPDRSYRNRHLA